jgi:hypothetical protein
MLSTRRRVDHCIPLWIQGHRVDVRPVPRLAGPARWVTLLGLDVQLVPSRQDGLVVAGVALLRAHVLDAAVAMIDVAKNRGKLS